MIFFSVKHFDYEKGRFKPKKHGDSTELLWQYAAKKLNQMGCVKSADLWKKTCADFRMQVMYIIYSKF